MSSLALYRTYRPGRFADVVGQEHVTTPLMRALQNDRVHHAYLFSGPRGCGKTSSARILARSLNCEKGPTPEPCGQCQSCLDLAPNGSGSIDVIELDAATHGLVDDARDLREKAHFAPASSRFKIYIIDEAHQLGPGAANALLKLIEEPPPHLKFIFATTAPDKILGTIRSRTHHYPFRLIPAKTLQQNLASICEQEGVSIEPAALALVARAGAGSARDAQSVLGQLMAGADDDGITYDLAVALLGFTDAALLDQIVDAIAVGDAPTVFAAIDQVMDSGHDPRRFLTDLLERFRDLVVVRAVPDAVSTGLLEAPEDEAERMASQATIFGPADLVRLADVVDEGITAMKGATPTRLQLELVCARLLLPGADDTTAGVQARLDRLERRVVDGPPAPTVAAPPVAARPADQPAPTRSTQPSVPVSAGDPSPPTRPEPAREVATDSGPVAASPELSADQPATTPDPVPEPAPAASASPEPAAAAPVAAPATPTAPADEPVPAAGSVADVRRMWPEVLARLKEIKRTPWSLISQESAVVDVADGVLTLAFRQPTLRDTFTRRDDFQTFLKQALKDVLLIDLKIVAIVDPSADPAAAASGSAPAAAGPAAPSPGAGQRAGGTAPSTGESPPAAPGAASGPDPDTGKGTDAPARPESGGRADAARAAARRTNSGQATPTPGDPRSADDRDADPDDADLEDNAVSQRDLLARTLGATFLEEIEHER